MPSCPICGAQYRVPVSNCAECDVALEEDSSATTKAARDDVLIAEVANEVLAATWQAFLNDKGILCLVKAAGVSLGGWGYATLLPHFIYVRRDQAARALALLRPYAEGDPSLTLKPID